MELITSEVFMSFDYPYWSLLLSLLLPFATASARQVDFDMLAVGGGAAGLTTVYMAHKAGLKAGVLEAAPTPGGRIQSIEVNGYQQSRGPQFVLNNQAYEDFGHLAREVGVDKKKRGLSEIRVVYVDGDFRQVDESDPYGSFYAGLVTDFYDPVRSKPGAAKSATQDLLSAMKAYLDPDSMAQGGKIVRAFQKVFGITKGLRLDEVEGWEKLEDGEGAMAWMQKAENYGPIGAKRVGVPAMKNLFFKIMSKPFLFWMISNADPKRTDNGAPLRWSVIEGGYQSFINAVAAKLPPESIMTNSPVKSVRQRKGYVKVTLENGKILTAKRVVMATPGPIMKEQLGGTVPEFNHLLDTLKYASTGVINIVTNQNYRKVLGKAYMISILTPVGRGIITAASIESGKYVSFPYDAPTELIGVHLHSGVIEKFIEENHGDEAAAKKAIEDEVKLEMAIILKDPNFSNNVNINTVFHHNAISDIQEGVLTEMARANRAQFDPEDPEFVKDRRIFAAGDAFTWSAVGPVVHGAIRAAVAIVKKEKGEDAARAIMQWGSNCQRALAAPGN